MSPSHHFVAALAAALTLAPGLTLGQSYGAPAVPLGVTVIQTDLYCTAYGNLPQVVVPGISAIAQGKVCLPGYTSQVLQFVDNNGNNRTACFYPNSKATKSQPLPLVTWLHPSLSQVAMSLNGTGLPQTMNLVSLNNENSSAVGFHLLTPGGLYGTHEYPQADRVGLGWDNWYRNFNRSSSTLNADVQTVDYFIKTVNATGLADPRRLYMSGWSNGAAFAEQYALVTSGIAAAAVYSAPDPWRDDNDQCAQVPLPNYATPTLDVHNACDLWGICTTGKYYRDDLTYRYPQMPTNITIISSSLTAPQVLGNDAAAQCDPTCTPFNFPVNATATAIGSAAHERWPYMLNSIFTDYLLQHPLPASGSWARLNPAGVSAAAYPNVVTGVGYNASQCA